MGMFTGVFTPSILTILGIILFLRLGYVVGNAGLGRALIILALANGISLLTTFSLSAIATNLKVKGGGIYYLISRTLGLEFGGAIGIVLFLAQSLSIAFYCIGFGEVLTEVISPEREILPQMIAAASVAFLFIFAWLGTNWATRFQYVVMGILAAALLSFFWGGLTQWNNDTLIQNWPHSDKGLPFWSIFAIFFPAVTGFTQGASMSGDLKDPGKSLTLGTFLAVGISILIYYLAGVVFAASQPADVLISDYGAMKRVAAVEFLVIAGVVAATLSSAMASFLGAPRILQSLSSDRIFPFLLPFAKGYGSAGNPRRGVILSAGIAFATIGLGKLNIIAPVVSMFFLISYGLLNYATFFEARTASPSFRPRFKLYNAYISLAGAVACLFVMLAIDLTSGVIAAAILFAIYQYLKRTAGPARWADSRRSYHIQRVREHLLAASKEQEHPLNWRPQLLLLSDNPQRRKQLLHFASWFEGECGFITAVKIIYGEGTRMLKRREEAEEELRNDIRENNIEAFPLVVAATDLNQGIHMLVQAHGIGPLKANTILLNWLENKSEGRNIRELLYVRHLKTAFRLGCNIIILDAKLDEWNKLLPLPSRDRRIDVWWWNDNSSHLMLLLAYLMTRCDAWEESKIRVMAPCLFHRQDETKKHLQKKLEEVRIDAELEIVFGVSTDVIVNQSADAALVFLPFRLSGDKPLSPLGNPIDQILECLPITALVLAAEDIVLDAEPEDGKAGEIAATLDAVADAEKLARKAEKETVDATEALTDLKKELIQMEEKTDKSEVDEFTIFELKKAVRDAEQRVEITARRSAKLKAKAEDTAQSAREDGYTN
ncbi:MAG: amino acid permease [Candidatus Scalindua sp.]|nr:amino acid permease [Candidatus Scalindua sp.]